MKRNDNFYRNVSDWTYEIYLSQSLWLRRSLFANVALLFLLGTSLIVYLLLVPLKEKIPYLYAFDHATGEITKIGTLEKTPFEGNWELTRYFLIQYVINYESYNVDNIDRPYQLVWAQSAGDVKKKYADHVSSSNSKSPYQRYGKDKYITVHVTAINKLNNNTVNVKFEKTLHEKTTGSSQTIHKEAIIKWEFSKAEISQKLLDRDPLGFKVIYYQTSQINLDQI